MEDSKSMQHEIAYQGETIIFETVSTESLPNHWKKFFLRSDDERFIAVFGKDQIAVSLDPNTDYSPDMDIDYHERTGEQTILVKEIWDELRKLKQTI